MEKNVRISDMSRSPIFNSIFTTLPHTWKGFFYSEFHIRYNNFILCHTQETYLTKNNFWFDFDSIKDTKDKKIEINEENKIKMNTKIFKLIYKPSTKHYYMYIYMHFSIYMGGLYCCVSMWSSKFLFTSMLPIY